MTTQSGQAGKVVDVRLGLYNLLSLLCFVLGPVDLSEARQSMRVQSRLLRSSLSVRQRAMTTVYKLRMKPAPPRVCRTDSVFDMARSTIAPG